MNDTTRINSLTDRLVEVTNQFACENPGSTANETAIAIGAFFIGFIECNIHESLQDQFLEDFYLGIKETINGDLD